MRFVAALACTLVGCGTLLSNGPDEEASHPVDAGLGADAAGLDAVEASADVVADAGNPSCFEPTSGNVLVMKPGAQPKLVHGFDFDRDIRRSIVDVDLDVAGAGMSWTGGYFGLIGLGYGDSDYYGDVPVTSLAVSPAIEANVWRARGTGSTFYEYHAVSEPALASGAVSLRLDVDWADPGTVAVTINATRKAVGARTLEAPRQKRLTVAIGGATNGTFPEHTITVKKICVTFQ